MKRIIITPIALLFSVVASAGNYATCLLEKLPGLQSDAAAMAAAQLCRDEYPTQYEGVEPGAGRGIFSFDSGAECTIKKAGATTSRSASFQIRVACNRLYDEPKPWMNWNQGAFDQFEKGP